MSEPTAVFCTRTDWNALSPATKALIKMFASSPVWAFTGFEKPLADLTDELLGAAWNRAGFGEQELRANPEIVVGTLKKLVADQLLAH